MHAFELAVIAVLIYFFVTVVGIVCVLTVLFDRCAGIDEDLERDLPDAGRFTEDFPHSPLS